MDVDSRGAQSVTPIITKDTILAFYDVVSSDRRPSVETMAAFLRRLENDLQLAHHRTSGWARQKAGEDCKARHEPSNSKPPDLCCSALWPWFYRVVLQSPSSLVTTPSIRQELFRNTKIDYCPFCGSRVTK